MTTRKRKTTDKQKQKQTRVNPIAVIFAVCAAVAIVVGVWLTGLTGVGSGDRWVHIPRGSSDAAVRDSLTSALGNSMGRRVYLLWRLQGGEPTGARGAYLADGGTTAIGLAYRLAHGRQTPVKITFTGARTMPMLAERIASQLDISADEVLEGAEHVLPEMGLKKPEFPAAFLPDTYEVYWTWNGDKIVERIAESYTAFWNDKRKAKAAELGLTPAQVATVASIAEEETAKADELPMVARLYMNRLGRGMKLQADPTVKFAVGDFSIRRIGGEMLRNPSPYNTYMHVGLPPGPIRTPRAASMQAVLDAPRHDYLYMCAREDFSGYHNFAKDYATHQANARRYQAELNRRNIH